MKYIHPIAALLAALLLTLLLCGCSAVESAVESAKKAAELLKSESGEIREFYGFKGSTLPDEPVYTIPEEREAPPILPVQTHTELLRSIWNPGNTIVSGADLDLAADSSQTELTETEKFGYTAVARPSSLRAEDFLALLEEAGIKANTETRRNPAPAGEVFAIRYAGEADRDGFYLNPDVPVTLFVSAEKPAKTAESGDNLVYLTFDDGPTETDTLRLLDILDEYGVKAAFFAMGEAVQANPASAKAISERGHALGCHTVTHVYENIYASKEALETEALGWEKIVTDAGAVLPEKGKLFRFPGGSEGSWLTQEESAEYRAMLEEHGYLVFDWNVVINDAVLFTAPAGESPYDFIKESFAQTYEACLQENAGKSGAPIIVLMHETVPQTIDLMPWMLEYLLDRGCVFGDLRQLDHSWTFADRRG